MHHAVGKAGYRNVAQGPQFVATDRAIAPVGQARDDRDIFRGVAAQMDVEEAFTEGRSPEDWQRWIYDVSRQQAAREGVELHDWETFQQKGRLRVEPSNLPAIKTQAP